MINLRKYIRPGIHFYELDDITISRVFLIRKILNKIHAQKR